MRLITIFKKSKSVFLLILIAVLFLLQCSDVGVQTTTSFQSIQNYYYSASDNSEFYFQLTTFQKWIYNQFSIEKLLNSPKGIQVFSNLEENQHGLTEKNISFDFSAAFDAYCKDKPEFFWVNGYNAKISKNTSNKTTFSLHVNFETYSDSYFNQTKEKYRTMINLVNSVDSSGKTQYQQLKNIHDWIANNIDYNISNQTGHDAFGTLTKKQGVCEGYAKIFKLACDRVNIPCILVAGNASPQDGSNSLIPHMWNYVFMDDNKWYAVDVTWNDQTEKSSRKILYDYFLVGSNTLDTHFSKVPFNQSHVEMGYFSTGAHQNSKEFYYPTLSSDKYDESRAKPVTSPKPTTTTTYTPSTSLSSVKTPPLPVGTSSTSTQHEQTTTSTMPSLTIYQGQSSYIHTKSNSENTIIPSTNQINISKGNKATLIIIGVLLLIILIAIGFILFLIKVSKA